MSACSSDLHRAAGRTHNPGDDADRTLALLQNRSLFDRDFHVAQRPRGRARLAGDLRRIATKCHQAITA
jgi:hypothetical protein